MIPLDMVFTRLSEAYYYDLAGALSLSTTNAPREEWNPEDSKYRGFLLEEKRTNLFKNNRDASEWNLVRVLEEEGELPAPLAGDTFWHVAASTDDSTHYVSPDEPIFMDDEEVYTFSCYFRPGEYTRARFRVNTSVVGHSVEVEFDLLSGEGSHVSGKPTIAFGSYPLEHGALRAWVTFRNGPPIGTQELQILLVNNNGDSSFQGNDSDGIHVWGPQFEKGRGVTSFIPTDTFEVDREDDKYSLSGPDFTNKFNKEKFTALIDFISDSVQGSKYSVMTFSDGTEEEQLGVRRTSSDDLEAYWGNQSVTIFSNYRDGSRARVALSFSDGLVTVAANGVIKGSLDVSGWGTPTFLNIGSLEV